LRGAFKNAGGLSIQPPMSHLPRLSLRSLRTKMVLQVVAVALVALAAITALSVSRSGSDERKALRERTAQQASANANQVDSDFAGRLLSARTAASFLDGLPNTSRSLITGQLHRLLLDNPTIAATYVGFDRNAFDGQDARFAGIDKGSDKAGRFLPYWNRLTGKVQLTPLTDMDTSDYYVVPKRVGHAVVVEPYPYSGQLMTSFVAPVFKNGKAVGIAGNDYVLSALTKRINDIRLLKSGYAFLVTDKGLLATAPEKGAIGKATLNGLASSKDNPALARIATAVKAGKAGSVTTTDPFNGKKSELFWSPVKTGGWAIVVSVPQSEMMAPVHALARTLIIVALIGLIVLGIAVFFIATRLTRPIEKFVARLRRLREHDVAGLQTGLEAIAGGDLTYRTEADREKLESLSNDEIGDAGRTLNDLIDSTSASVDAYEASRRQLGTMIGGVSEHASRVRQSSEEVAGISEESGRASSDVARAVGDIAQSSETQVQRVVSARDGVGEVGSAARDSAGAAQETASAAEQAREVARQGVQAAEEATEAMSSVRESTEGVTAAIEQLAGKSQQIGGIVDTITAIAEQTNLLALNAAIEAARAGDQGRGFAVVAEEVRKLAEESQDAAASISTLIKEIREETDRAVEVVNDGARRTIEGATTVERTREAFTTIGSSVEDVSARVEQIAAAAERIAASAARVEKDVEEIAAIAEESSAATEEVSASTEQTSASTQQVSASAQELNRTAGELAEMVAAFRLEA
jgi:methyl-accepting chemotaxis protein